MTSDALHTVRANLNWLVTTRRLTTSPCEAEPAAAARPGQGPALGAVPASSTARGTGHRRTHTRTLKAAHVNDLDFPHARQAIKITRRRKDTATGKISRQTVYAVTSLPARMLAGRTWPGWSASTGPSRHTITSAT